ncbi:MAG: hypothetical protein Q9220_007660 [cf. Caloplaca sp. 1 TL-2023]
MPHYNRASAPPQPQASVATPPTNPPLESTTGTQPATAWWKTILWTILRAIDWVPPPWKYWRAVVLVIIAAVLLLSDSSASKAMSNTKSDASAWTGVLRDRSDPFFTKDTFHKAINNVNQIAPAVNGTEAKLQAQVHGHMKDAQEAFKTSEATIQNLGADFTQRNKDWPREFALFEYDIGNLQASKNSETPEFIRTRTLQYAWFLLDKLGNLLTTASEFDKHLGLWATALDYILKLLEASQLDLTAEVKQICSSWRYKWLTQNEGHMERKRKELKQAGRLVEPVGQVIAESRTMNLESNKLVADLEKLYNELDGLIDDCEVRNQCQDFIDHALQINRQLAKIGARILFVEDADAIEAQDTAG